MKKALIFFTLGLFNISLFAQGQHMQNDAVPTMAFYTGISLGGSFTNMIFDNEFDFEEVKPKLGYSAGFAVRMDYVFQYFDLDLGLLYSRKGANAKNM